MYTLFILIVKISTMNEIEKYFEKQPYFTPAVAGYLVKDNKVLLGMRKKVSNGLGKNLIAGIGGKVGDQNKFKGETLEQALEREVMEEIRVTINSYQNLGKMHFIFPHKEVWNYEVSVYLVTEWNGEPTETEVIKPIWFEIENLPQDSMWEDNLYWLPLMLNGSSVDGIFLYDKNGKIKEYELHENY